MTQYKTLKRLMINDEGFAFDPMMGYTYTMNPTAQKVIGVLKQGGDYEAVLSAVTEEYEVERQTADRDLESFLEQLKRFRLCEEAEEAE